MGWDLAVAALFQYLTKSTKTVAEKAAALKMSAKQRFREFIRSSNTSSAERLKSDAKDEEALKKPPS
jgi:hypothetical protein